MTTQLSNRRNVLYLVRRKVEVEAEVVGDPPEEDLSESAGCSVMDQYCSRVRHTLPSSEPDATRESLKGFLCAVSQLFRVCRSCFYPTSLCREQRRCALGIAVYVQAGDPSLWWE
jgi:hypothetical protein